MHKCGHTYRSLYIHVWCLSLRRERCAGRCPIRSSYAADPRPLTLFPGLVRSSFSPSLASSEFLNHPEPQHPRLTLSRSWQLGPNSSLTTLPELTTVIILHRAHWSLKVIPGSLLAEVNRCVWTWDYIPKAAWHLANPRNQFFPGNSLEERLPEGIFFPLFSLLFSSCFPTCTSDLMIKDTHRCPEHCCASQDIKASTAHLWT